MRYFEGVNSFTNFFLEAFTIQFLSLKIFRMQFITFFFKECGPYKYSILVSSLLTTQIRILFSLADTNFVDKIYQNFQQKILIM